MDEHDDTTDAAVVKKAKITSRGPCHIDYEVCFRVVRALSSIEAGSSARFERAIEIFEEAMDNMSFTYECECKDIPVEKADIPKMASSDKKCYVEVKLRTGSSPDCIAVLFYSGGTLGRRIDAAGHRALGRRVARFRTQSDADLGMFPQHLVSHFSESITEESVNRLDPVVVLNIDPTPDDTTTPSETDARARIEREGRLRAQYMHELAHVLLMHRGKACSIEGNMTHNDRVGSMIRQLRPAAFPIKGVGVNNRPDKKDRCCVISAMKEYLESKRGIKFCEIDRCCSSSGPPNYRGGTTPVGGPPEGPVGGPSPRNGGTTPPPGTQRGGTTINSDTWLNTHF